MTMATSAVVLAAGRGTRMQRAGNSPELNASQAAAAALGLKSMIPDARGRPFIDHVLSSLADAGVADVCMVVSPGHELLRRHLELHTPQRVTVSLAEQREPTGTADALLAAEEWSDGRDVLVLNADNIYPHDAIRALVMLDTPGFVAFDRESLLKYSNIEASRIAAFATVTLASDGTLAGIVEKPPVGTIGDSRWISMNIWRFDERIFAACRDVAISPRGERELPLAVALAVARGMKLRAVESHDGVLDLSHRGDIATVAALLGDREIAP